jgi:hypothetical protein
VGHLTHLCCPRAPWQARGTRPAYAMPPPPVGCTQPAMLLICDVFGCGFTTSRESYLSVHQRVHNGGAVFGCIYPACGAVFAERRSLATHECKHTGERPFVCSQLGCTYATASKPLLHAHVKRHKGILSHKCLVEGCGYASTSRSGLTWHSRTTHNFIPAPKKAQKRRSHLYTGEHVAVSSAQVVEM